MRIITLTTDFGSTDGYVGIVKGVILSISPHARLVDVSHEIASWDLRSAAWVIDNASQYFPEGTIHLCVVDPKVGSEQNSIVLTDGREYWVAPDNGILSLVLSRHKEFRAIKLTNRQFWRQSVSTSFHARDLYGPICAHLSEGVHLDLLGEDIHVDTLVRLPSPQFEKVGTKITGTIVYVDKFGNLITNIPAADLVSGQKCFVNGKFVVKFAGDTYSDLPHGEPIAFAASHGHLEIAINQGSAASQFQASSGATVELEPGE